MSRLGCALRTARQRQLSDGLDHALLDEAMVSLGEIDAHVREAMALLHTSLNTCECRDRPGTVHLGDRCPSCQAVGRAYALLSETL